MIHPSAIVHPTAVLSEGVEIGPYCIVGEHVTLGARTKLLAHVVGCPVVAVSHERKVATLMSELGHEAYCFPIDELDAAAASATLARVLAQRDAVSAHIREVAAGYRRRVDAQCDAVFGAPR